MNTKANPYEYHNDMLGVQARFLIEGKNAHAASLRLIGERGLQMRITRLNIYKLRPQAPSQPMLVKWDSLPVTWQNLLISSFGEPQKQVRKSLFEQHYRRDSKAFDTYSTFTFADGTPIGDPGKVEEYTLNASVLKTVQTLYEKRRSFIKSLSGEVGGVWAILAREVAAFRAVHAHTLPDHVDNLRKELSKFRKEGYAGIISKRHNNSNARKVTTDVELFLNALFADYTEKPSKAEVTRQYEGFLAGYVEVINNETGEVYSPSDFPRLGISTIVGYLSRWRNAIATEGVRSGDRQVYMGKFKPYHSLVQPKFAGSIISVDDRQPAFEYEKGRRMWFYNAIDLGSEAFTCWVYGKSKDGIILDFYRQLVRNYAEWGLNLPAEIEAEASLNSSFTETFLKEGNMFQYVRIEANNARGKRIERYYGELRYRYEKKRIGWLARPFALSEANQEGPKEVPLVPYNELVAGCLKDIEDWNNAEHSKIKGKSRWEVFLSAQNPDVRPTNYRAIIPYLGYKTKTSCHAGIIALDNTEFLLGNNGVIAVGEQLVSLMDRAEGRELAVYWLDGNNGRVLKAYVYVGDTFICEAVCKPDYNRARIERTDADEVNLTLMSSYVATIEGYGRQRRREIDLVTVVDNTPTTISSTFKIAGVSRYAANETPTETMPPIDDFENEFNTDLNSGSTTGRKILSAATF